MRLGETLEQEAQRKREEAELPGRIQSLRERIRQACATLREVIADRQRLNNPGGERSGTLE